MLNIKNKKITVLKFYSKYYFNSIIYTTAVSIIWAILILSTNLFSLGKNFEPKPANSILLTCWGIVFTIASFIEITIIIKNMFYQNSDQGKDELILINKISKKDLYTTKIIFIFIMLILKFLLFSIIISLANIWLGWIYIDKIIFTNFLIMLNMLLIISIFILIFFSKHNKSLMILFKTIVIIFLCLNIYAMIIPAININDNSFALAIVMHVFYLMPFFGWSNAAWTQFDNWEIFMFIAISIIGIIGIQIAIFKSLNKVIY